MCHSQFESKSFHYSNGFSMESLILVRCSTAHRDRVNMNTTARLSFDRMCTWVFDKTRAMPMERLLCSFACTPHTVLMCACIFAIRIRFSCATNVFVGIDVFCIAVCFKNGGSVFFTIRIGKMNNNKCVLCAWR